MGEIASKTDFYKTVHPDMHNKDTTVVMNNLTGRRSMIQGVNDIIVFGNQYYIKNIYWKNGN